MNAETNHPERPRHTVPLPGCHPVPLASYLKGLGLFRLVAEQVDPDARCYWKNEGFVLVSNLDADKLIDFLLNQYRPSPIMAPWNSGSGFYFQEEKLKEKDPLTGKRKKTGIRNQPTEATRTIDGLLNSSNPRLTDLRTCVQIAKKILHEQQLTEAPDDNVKDFLISTLRNRLPDSYLWCLDAAYTLLPAGAKPPPLLGSGLNDGNLEFSNNFIQHILKTIPDQQNKKRENSDKPLHSCLFGLPEKTLEKTSVGQFDPFNAGGTNAGTGFDSASSINPWDFILTIEGTLLFSASFVRKFQYSQQGQLSFPFCVRSVGVGYPSGALADENKEGSRAEMWMPLWKRPANLYELRSILGEGRAQISGRPARNGVDFARAAVSLGIDRGLSEFQRFGFLKRNGRSHFATPLDRLPVQRNRYVRLLEEIDPWLDRFRSRAASTNPEPPAGVASALRRLENSILRLCQTEDPARVQDVLCALGHCERTVARSLRWTRETAHLRPIHGLSVAWANAADTGHAEYRLALSLASSTLLTANTQFPFRYFLEPVNHWGNHWREESLRDTAWTDGSLAYSLNAILHRQLLIAQNSPANGETSHFAHFARKTAPLPDIAAFIEDTLDEPLFADLLWGLSLIDWTNRDQVVEVTSPPNGHTPDALYSLLKLCFAGSSIRETTIPVVPAIHNRATHGDAEEASRLASRRLRASGLTPVIEKVTASETHARRIAASLIFPISTGTVNSLDHQILLEPEKDRGEEHLKQEFKVS